MTILFFFFKIILSVYIYIFAVAQTPSNGSRCNTFNFSPETAEISPDDQRSISSVYPGKNQRKNQRKKQKTSRK